MKTPPLTPRNDVHSFAATDSVSSSGKQSSPTLKICVDPGSGSQTPSNDPPAMLLPRPARGGKTWVSSSVDDVGSHHSRKDTTAHDLIDIVAPLPFKNRRNDNSITLKTAGSSLTHRTVVTPSTTVYTAPAVGNGAAGNNSRKKRSTKIPPACCTFSIALYFAVMCSVIAGVFALTTALPVILFNREISKGVKATLSAGLEGTMTGLYGELKATITMAGQYRDMIEADPASYACDDGGGFHFPGNASNAGFMKAAGFFAVQRPDLRYIYKSR